MKRKKSTFDELMNQNKKELLLDRKMMDIIEERIEQRHLEKAE